MMESPFFGWELLSATVADSVRSASDLVVAFVHWQLIKLCFSCLGNGDEKSIQNEDCGSECLPDDWNGECNHYSLRYVLGNDVYILTCVVLEDSTCLFNLYNASKGTVSNMSVELREIMAFGTTYLNKKITEIIPKAEVLMLRVNQELIVPVAGCSGCSTDTPFRRPDPVPPPRPSADQKCIARDQQQQFRSTNCGIYYGPPINIGRNPCCAATCPPLQQQQQQQPNYVMQMPQNMQGDRECGQMPVACLISPNEQPQAMICNQSVQQPMMAHQSQQPMTAPQQFPRDLTCISPQNTISHQNQVQMGNGGPSLSFNGADLEKCGQRDESGMEKVRAHCHPAERSTSPANRNSSRKDCSEDDCYEVIWTVLKNP